MVSVLTILMESDCAGEVLPALSFTVTVNEQVHTAVGVPDIVPVELFKVNPEGRDPECTIQLLYGGVPPVAASCAEYTDDTAPFGSDVVVIPTPAAIVRANCGDT